MGRPYIGGNDWNTLAEGTTHLNRVALYVSESVEKGVLSEDEATLILKHVVSRFVQRGMDHVMETVFSPTANTDYLSQLYTEQDA